MSTPRWQASTKGTKVRVALWLHEVIGAGGSFTKQQLRDAFPGVEQVDRRMRDLRPEGWVISTYAEDRSLAADELRLLAEGGPVWEPGYRSRQQSAITDKVRRAVFAADSYSCIYCGVGGGEAYPDHPMRTAKLMVARVVAPEGGEPQLATCCDRCHVTGLADSALAVLADVEVLSAEGRDRLASWVLQGSRGASLEERLWGRYRHLPHEARTEVEAALRDGLRRG